MKVLKTNLKDVLVIEPDIYTDERGVFLETYVQKKYTALKIKANFVQDMLSDSNKGVIRGLHFQVKNPQGKLVQCIYGKIFDVVVDINPSSPTYRHFFSVELCSVSMRQVWIPPGYAHGFAVLSDGAMVTYKCTEYYDPSDERGIAWDDDEVNIAWPIKEPIISPKDKKYPSLRQFWMGKNCDDTNLSSAKLWM